MRCWQFFEAASAGQSLHSEARAQRKDGSLFIGADTPLGPLYLGYGHAEDGNSSWYFFLGRPF